MQGANYFVKSFHYNSSKKIDEGSLVFRYCVSSKRKHQKANILFFKFCRKFCPNKPGTAQVGAISKAQKQQKDFKVSKYSLLRYRKNPKVEPSWRTRGDTLRFFIHSVANHQKQDGNVQSRRYI